MNYNYYSRSTYRTKTYIAADWTNDKEAVDQLYKWKNSDHWSFDFVDAHDLTQSRDSSLNCSIKASLKKRLDASKTFVLIVGEQTNALRSGSCQYCPSYNSWNYHCTHGYTVDYRSYIEYECEKAFEANLKIVVLYYSTSVNKDKCPSKLKNTGTHIPMMYRKNGELYWNYQEIKEAIEN